MGAKGGGKGFKGKGKRGSKRSGKQQVRKELAGVVGHVLQAAGVHDAVNPRNMNSNKRKKTAATAAKSSTAPRGCRRLERKKSRKEQKSRRAYFFGEGRRKGSELIENGSTTVNGPSKQKWLAAAKPERPQKKRKYADDGEITSDEEGFDANRKCDQASVSEDGDDEGGKEEKQQPSEDAVEPEGEEEEDEAQGSEGNDSKGNVGRSVVGAPSSGAIAYVPPHLRKTDSKAAAVSESVVLHRRQLRGVMNRVTEGNLDSSAKELSTSLSKMVPEVGSAVAADDLLEFLVPAAVSDPNISVLVLGCYAALAVAMHVQFGSAFGGAAMLKVGTLLSQTLPDAENSGESTGLDSRVAKNCVAFEALLFNFGLLPGKTIFELVRFILQGSILTEIRVELALTTLRYAGRKLRGECPTEFKELLSFVSSVAANSQETVQSEQRSRVDFLLRELHDLKNNKVSFAAMERFDAIQGWLKTTPLLGGKNISDHSLSIPFKFLEEEVPENWPAVVKSVKTSSTLTGKLSFKGAEPLRALAIAQRLTTELRQSLFVALMGAEDFEHAADRLAHVAAGSKQGVNEACLIVFHCAIREKAPNPYYEHIANALCNRPAPSGKRFSHGFKTATAQHFKQAHEYGLRATVALAELVASMIASPTMSVPLSIVRFMKFADQGAGKPLGGTLGLLLRHMLDSLLRRLAGTDIAAKIFEPLQKYEDVREGLLLVMDGLVKPRLPSKGEDPLLLDKFRIARRQLGGTQK